MARPIPCANSAANNTNQTVTPRASNGTIGCAVLPFVIGNLKPATEQTSLESERRVPTTCEDFTVQVCRKAEQAILKAYDTARSPAAVASFDHESPGAYHHD
jgi:hypothetical protein